MQTQTNHLLPNLNTEIVMIRNYVLIFISLFLCFNPIFAQDVYQRNSSADVKHYIFNLSLNDENNEIKGEAQITVDLKNDSEPFLLDLIEKTEDFGMQLDGVFEEGRNANYKYVNDKILITPLCNGAVMRTFKIQYHGIPEKGLVIDTTKYGKRSFFGDNWPTLARHWLPCVDHPYDKASVEFRITAPEQYDVVATGEKVEESNLGNGFKLTSYSEPAPVAMKVVTIGVTKFATKLLGHVGDIPVTAWVYPENRINGFTDYGVAVEVLKYFIEHIGLYSYAKLANMQAKTQWGGLENAGTIAYFENSVTGKKEVEGLIAHEIAHQWFGNSASENSWNHVWLSEGFATYFAILYQESVYGNEKRQEELIKDRGQIFEYYKKNPSPVVDNTIKDPMKVLSTNTYQKGGWVLNMLRHKLGDDIFWKGIRAYYKTYKDSNAMTVDFKRVMEEISGQGLESFFNQWLFVKGYPELQWKWKYKNGKLLIDLTQLQKHHVFNFPLEIGIVNGKQMKTEVVNINEKSEQFEIELAVRPDNVVLDPEVWLLFKEIK